MRTEQTKELWRCPTCGRTVRVANTEPYGIRHDGQAWRVIHNETGRPMPGLHSSYEDAQKAQRNVNARFARVKPLDSPAIRNVRTADWDPEA